MLQKNETPNFLEKLIYGTGQIGLNALYTLFSSYVLIFYTDVIGINAATIGVIIAISKIFDGFSDQIAGQWIDTHKSKFGHCVPVLLRWTIPMTISVILVFMVPHSIPALQIAFIFVTYNLFNTVLYTFVAMAHTSLPMYATDDLTDRSQMMIYGVLFAAAMQMILASAIMPVVNFFGGQNLQSAWIKATLVFGIIGIIFLYMNAFFVRERVDNTAPPENIFVGIKAAFQNKYWILTLVMAIALNAILVFNLSVSVYYLQNVVGNLGLMGAYITASNTPMVIVTMIMPAFIKYFTKRKMLLFGCFLIIVAQIIFIFSPAGNQIMLFGTGVIKGIGVGIAFGLGNPMVADCVDYGEWKTGKRVQSALFAANSVGVKIGQGLLTSVFGFFLSAVGYDGLKEVQDASTITGINNFFRFGPLFAAIIMTVLIYFFKVEKQLPQIREELAKKRANNENI